MWSRAAFDVVRARLRGRTPVAPPSWFSDLRMVARLTRDFRSFYSHPITRERAIEIVKRQLETRHERFLEIVGQMIYRHPGSPYLELLRAAGCEFGDVSALVMSEGLEGALSRLGDAGVYISFDEFKGRKEVVRGSRRFTVAEADFDTPALSPHIEVRSGGTRGPGTRLKLELAFLADRAVTTALAYEAHGLKEYDKALWQITGLRPILQYTKTGKAPIAWFYPVRPLPFKSRAISWYLSALGRLFGHSLPRPVFLDLQDPGRMAQWLASRAKAGQRTCLTTYASSAVRVCAAAKEMGLDFGGVAFIVIGEPYTEARSKIVEDSGAHAVVGYAFNEAGTVGFGCRTPRIPDDVHLFSNMFGLIQRRRAIGDSRVAVDAFLVTSLLASGPSVAEYRKRRLRGFGEEKLWVPLWGIGIDDTPRPDPKFRKADHRGYDVCEHGSAAHPGGGLAGAFWRCEH